MAFLRVNFILAREIPLFTIALDKIEFTMRNDVFKITAKIGQRINKKST